VTGTPRESLNETGKPTYKMILFVVGDERNSRQARENIERFCEKHLQGRSEIEVIDVLVNYKKALECRVLITPALVVLSPPPTVRIAGTLEDASRVRAALCLPST
jgi:circadian clock protein KaiB